jgi:RNA polymerase sigma-70 factor, ECF subfamily
MELNFTATFTQQNNCFIGPCLSAMNDEFLVSAAKSGDTSAFVEICDRHSKKVLPSIYRITKNREDAEDAFQDTVLRAFVHVKSFEGRAKFTSWLTRIAINSALMILRKKRVPEVAIAEYDNDFEHWRPFEIPGRSETPEAYCERRENQELLRDAILRLPSILREVVELQHGRDYSVSQVADELGITLPAAKSRLSRARKVMRAHLSGGASPRRTKACLT